MKISDKIKIIEFLNGVKKKTGINSVVIGMSGGIDSTTAFFLLKEVYKPSEIYPAILDYYPKNNNDILSVLKTAKIPKNNILDISIRSVVDQFFDSIVSKGEDAKFFETFGAGAPRVEKNFGIEPLDKIRLGNIMARVRMIILFDLAKKVDGLVCGTENKSEHYLGYFTRFGDAASDIEPISNLYKTQVYELAKQLKVPHSFITKKPSANLWEDQTDEGEFGFTYLEADEVLRLFVDQKKDINFIKQQGHINAEKIIKRVKDNSFKWKVPYVLI